MPDHRFRAPGQPPAGLLPCDECGTNAAPRDGGSYFSLHFAKPTDRRPCSRSFPPPPTKKPKDIAP